MCSMDKRGGRHHQCCSPYHPAVVLSLYWGYSSSRVALAPGPLDDRQDKTAAQSAGTSVTSHYSLVYITCLGG